MLDGDDMEIMVKSKTPKPYKNKKLNNANFGDFTLNDYQVFLHLVSMVGKVDQLGKYLQPQHIEREHTITAIEFANNFNLNVKHAYAIIRHAGTKLMKSIITIEKPEINQTWEISICCIAKYNHKEGSITVKFTEEIIPYLAQVKKNFVLYNLKEISNFGSLYSTRLYELLQEFKETGWVLKSVEQLRAIFAVGEKLALYKNFKKYTFAHAVAEINSQYDINLKFEEIKAGKKVAAVRFTFKQTFVRKFIDPLTGNKRNQYIKPKRKPPEIKIAPPHQEFIPIEQTSITQKISLVNNQPATSISAQLESTPAPEADAAPQKEPSSSIDTKPSELSNLVPQKKKRFFGLF